MINELSPYETPEQIQQAENCCFNKSDWVLKVDEESWVNCFKKYSNTDAKIKGYLAKLEEKPNAEPWKPWTCPIPPFKSHELLKKIQVNGSVSCVLRYLEYLTLVCNVQDEKLHTELGCLFVRYIAMIVKNSGSQVEVEKLKRDRNINDLRERLRKFLTKSVLYEPLEIERLIVPAEGEENVKREVLAIKHPVRALLAKELAILKMRIG